MVSNLPLSFRAKVITAFVPSCICLTLRPPSFPACKWQFNTYHIRSDELVGSRKAVNSVRSLWTAGETKSHFELFQKVAGRKRPFLNISFPSYPRLSMNWKSWSNERGETSWKHTTSGSSSDVQKFSMNRTPTYVVMTYRQ